MTNSAANWRESASNPAPLRKTARTISMYALATDGTFLYFAWRLDESNIWVTDILPE